MPRWSSLTVLWVGLAGALPGCTVDHDLYTCLNPDPGHVDGQGKDDPCHTRPTCPGQCVPGFSFDWLGPVLVWMGPASEASMVQCPPEAPTANSTRFADLTAPNACAACSCAPPEGSCELPTTITARAAICPGAGAWVTPFDAPAAWDGSCTDLNAIPQGKDCGGVPCVQSVTIAPLQVVESGCSPIEGPPPVQVLPASWGSAAILCNTDKLEGEELCMDPGLTCAPRSAPLPASFHRCIYKDGVHECPPAYPVRNVVYERFEDNRTCSPCQCGEAMGSTCTAALSFFQDSACSVPLPLTLGASSVKAMCGDAPPGLALGSKFATEPVYTPGVCQPSGGEPQGAAEPVGPATICCLPEP
uniref:Uncharacterized protein n=1 Tax=Racemicystis crocea TaxID=1707966 RepID=A0A3S7V0N3_9BACT|nr:hypothetical protein [Racemicystis crocea]